MQSALFIFFFLVVLISPSKEQEGVSIFSLKYFEVFPFHRTGIWIEFDKKKKLFPYFLFGFNNKEVNDPTSGFVQIYSTAAH